MRASKTILDLCSYYDSTLETAGGNVSRHLETSASPTLLLHSKRAKWATKFRVSNHSLNSEMLTPTSREVCRYTSGFEGELGSRERRN